jgi:hypothetical protein
MLSLQCEARSEIGSELRRHQKLTLGFERGLSTLGSGQDNLCINHNSGGRDTENGLGGRKSFKSAQEGVSG